MATKKKNLISHLSATTKLAFSFVMGAAGYFLFPLKPLLHLVFSWDIFCLCLLVLTWITFFTTATQDIRSEAQQQDDSRILIFIITLIATALSMFSVIQMIISGPGDELYKTFNLCTGVGCMFLSWFLVHTIFAMRYAHLYYAKDEHNKAPHAGGLDFPGETRPDFIDFAYYAFTLGMTFQVSDVEISSRKIRRLSLLHGMFSFGYNAVIIALSVNIIAGLVA